MYLKNLHLINFQNHSELEINFVNGVNVLYGNTDSGKSTIKHAIEFLCQHDTFVGQRKLLPKGSKQTFTKITSVKGEFDNGIIVERIVSNSINRYILTKDGKESIFDSVGRTAPPEIQEAIGIYPITVDGEEIFLNSQSQIALPFLYDKSPSFRHKLFNKLTGNDVLDKLFGGFNKDILRIKRGRREETEQFEKRAENLKNKLIEKEKTEVIYSKLRMRIKNIKKLYEKYSKLLELKELEKMNTSSLQEVNFKLKNLKLPEPEVLQRLITNIECYDKLKTVKNASEKVCVSLGKVRGQLKVFVLPTVDISSLKGKIERYEALKYINNSFKSNEVGQTQNKEEIRDIKMVLKNKTEEYKKLLKEAQVLCPKCKHDITEECLRR